MRPHRRQPRGPLGIRQPRGAIRWMLEQFQSRFHHMRRIRRFHHTAHLSSRASTPLYQARQPMDRFAPDSTIKGVEFIARAEEGMRNWMSANRRAMRMVLAASVIAGTWSLRVEAQTAAPTPQGGRRTMTEFKKP